MIGIKEIESRRFTGIRAIEIGRSPHDDDAAKVREIVDGAAKEGFERSIIFLRGGAVSAGAIGEQAGGILKGLGKEVPGEVVVGRSDIAFDDGRGASAGREDGRGGVVGAVSDGGAGVVEGGSTGEGGGGLFEDVVELEDLGAVDALWVLRRRG